MSKKKPSASQRHNDSWLEPPVTSVQMLAEHPQCREERGGFQVDWLGWTLWPPNTDCWGDLAGIRKPNYPAVSLPSDWLSGNPPGMGLPARLEITHSWSPLRGTNWQEEERVGVVGGGLGRPSLQPKK